MNKNINAIIEDGHLGGFMSGGDPATWFPNLWNWLVKLFAIHSVIDIGCGQGYAVNYFIKLGINAIGIEGSQEAINSNIAPYSVVQHDFYQNAYTPNNPVDLIWSCEFLEHIDEQHLKNVLVTFQSATKAIVLTHAFPGQDGHHHVNCQPSTYWIGLIRHLGFKFSLRYTLLARYITMKDYHQMNHFGRSGLVFLVPREKPYKIEACNLASIITTARNPSIITMYYGIILKIENILLRGLRKLGCFK
jgi:SAM-dependent methyltransferase